MKYFMLVALLGFPQSAFCSDAFTDEIVCIAIREPGQGGNDLEVVVQSNPTAWVKRIAIIENGFLGTHTIGVFTVTVDQPRVSAPGYFNGARIATYESSGLTLVMDVKDAKGGSPSGPGHVDIDLPKYPHIQATLNCQALFTN